MTKSESKYFNTAEKMNQAFFTLIEKKDYDYITIKDVCKEAGVNRSTFYLHYETMNDLLEESVQNSIKKLTQYMNPESLKVMEKIKTCDLKELYFITPEYLIPYLTYIKNNQKIYRLFFQKATMLHLDQQLQYTFQDILMPILERYHVPIKDRDYLVAFCISGLTGIVKVWLKHDCQDDISHVSDLMQQTLKKVDMDLEG